MLSQTRRALEDFDNQHDFERLAADALNALGYAGVEPMAPRGGGDSGCDVRFWDGKTRGTALVTLDKKIQGKFRFDLSKQPNDGGLLALFCVVDVTPAQKLTFAKEALDKGYGLEVFDLERLRSLLDSALKDIRRRYLGIDDEIAARLRSEVARLLHFPAASGETTPPPTLLEGMLVNKVPRRLFDLLLGYDETVVREVPGIGETLHAHLLGYYRFRQDVLNLEERLLPAIGRLSRVRFAAGWRIYLKYVLMRFAGHSQAAIVAGGDFLNYEITWEDAERVFQILSGDASVASQVPDALNAHEGLAASTSGLLRPSE